MAILFGLVYDAGKEIFHVLMPCQLRFVINGILKIPEYMGQTFLMAAPIIVKGDIMVMNEDLKIFFYRSSFNSFVAFMLSGAVQGFVWICADQNLYSFTIYPARGEICMHGRRQKEHLIDPFPISLCCRRKLPGERIDQSL